MNFSKIKIFLITSICALSIAISLGNFFHLGIFSRNTVHLGLDLRGGSEILLKIDYDGYIKEQINNAIDDLKDEFRKNGIRIVPRMKIDNKDENKIEYISINDINSISSKKLKQIVKKINNNLIVENTDDEYLIKYDNSAIGNMKYKILEQSIEIVRRRVDETGTKEPIIQTQGDDRILLQVPGMQDPNELKQVLGKTAKMTFHLLDGSILPGTQILPSDVIKMSDREGKYEYYVNKKVVLNGDLLQDANATYSEGKPVVAFKFNSLGSKKFGEITKNNIGKILVIALDNQVITAPRINTPILGGSGIITGSFSSEEANQVALLLRAGALPAPLEVIQERVVGPSLGQDSIHSGLNACLIGLLCTLLFMVILYKFFGLITNITLIMNLFITLAALSLLNATLTLPGIAGIVLSIGMAVDTNVLIFERIREEYKKTQKVYNSVTTGFDFAWSTIFDSNITTLLSAIIIYMLGTGSVKGFALVLGIGIFASLFTGVLLTKLFLLLWLNWFKPKKINL